MSDTDQSPERLRDASQAVFLAADEGPAADLSARLLWAADEIDRLRAEVERLRGEREDGYVRGFVDAYKGISGGQVSPDVEAYARRRLAEEKPHGS